MNCLVCELLIHLKLWQDQINKQNQIPRENSGMDTLPVIFGPISASLQIVSGIFSAGVCVLWKDRKIVLSVQVFKKNGDLMLPRTGIGPWRMSGLKQWLNQL